MLKSAKQKPNKTEISTNKCEKSNQNKIKHEDSFNLFKSKLIAENI